MSGRIDETYAAAIQHDIVDVSGGETLVGVVRRPPGWFRATVDENVRALGPPDALLDEVEARADDLRLAGFCDEEAHNAAWTEVDFETRYREHLATAAADARDRLAARARDGEDLVLVCFEGPDKRCHRHLLVAALRDRT
ncbi:MAG: DUF488 family protein [Haloarculaceae archaeon]